jgi:hypothetical protein
MDAGSEDEVSRSGDTQDPGDGCSRGRDDRSIMIDATLKLPPNSSAAVAWAPVREELSKVALAYEVTPLR